ncbi:MAG: hypothetical protein H6536_01735 [Bacteroidales bacterium]|nr:hypothetical protein [Bacteroidales bacterium]
MKSVLKIEMLKTLGYPIFWAIILLHASFFVLVVLMGANLHINIQEVHIFRLFSSNYMWGTIAWIASWFNLLLAILIIVLTSNELTYNTFRKQILDGLNRNQLITGKLAVIGSLTAYVIIIVTITGFTVSLTSSEPWAGSYLNGYKYVMVLGIQSIAYMSLAFLAGLLFRNTALAIVAYLLYFIIAEPFIRLLIPSGVDSFFPVKIISNLTPAPDFLGILASDLSNVQGIDPNTTQQLQTAHDGMALSASLPVCAGYIILFVVLSGLLLKLRDL